MVDGPGGQKTSEMDGKRSTAAAVKKAKKDELDNLKKEVEMVRDTFFTNSSSSRRQL